LVLRAAAATPQSALEKLCTIYWSPVHVFIRGHVDDPQEAEDLTQAFFTNLIDKRTLGSVRPDVSRFRAFLLASVRHFLANERDRARALKRGGGRAVRSIEGDAGHPALDIAGPATPEQLFERKWAHLLLGRALESVRRQYEKTGHADEFEALKNCLAGSGQHAPYAEIGANLGLSEGAVKMATHRLRRRFGEALRAEVAETVADPAEVEDEMRYLLGVVSG
jgi:RNA polymerase sigma factor (sigma-70 family)